MVPLRTQLLSQTPVILLHTLVFVVDSMRPLSEYKALEVSPDLGSTVD